MPTKIYHPTIEDGLIFWWLPAEPTGVKAYDLTDFKRHGDIYGATWATGLNGYKALDFDGVDDRVDTPNFGQLTRFTVMGWCYRRNTAAFHAMSSQGDVTAKTRTWWLGGRSGATNAHFELQWTDGTSTIINVGPFPLNTWTHIAGSYDGSQMRVYINGILRRTTEVAKTPAAPLAVPHRIGAAEATLTNFFPGLITDVRIYNRALTDDEIRAIYEEMKPS